MMEIGTSYSNHKLLNQHPSDNIDNLTLLQSQNNSVEEYRSPHEEENIYLKGSSVTFDWKLILICSIAGVTLVILALTVII